MILPPGEVHIYQASLKKNDARIMEDIVLLSEDERYRADRFHFEKDRLRFIFRRSLLRRLLSRYTGQESASIHFNYGKHGKPYLMDRTKGNTCFFNCSNSMGNAVFVFSASGPLGVDCEYSRRELDFTGITKRFFSQSEISAFLSLPEHCRREAFFNCWTRKEAFLKAKGEGLSIGLDQFDVSLRPGEPPKLLRTRYDEKDASEWCLYDLKVSPGFKSSLATHSARLKLISFDSVL